MERWLQVSPDNGSGTFEFAFFIVVLTLIALPALRAWRARRERARSGGARGPRRRALFRR